MRAEGGDDDGAWMPEAESAGGADAPRGAAASVSA